MEIIRSLHQFFKQIVGFVMKNPGTLFQVIANFLRVNQKTMSLIKTFGKATMIASI